MQDRIRRGVAAFGMAALAGACVTACDTGLWQGPIAVRGAEESLEIAVCSFGAVDRIEASYRSLSTELEWVPFWESSVTLWLDRGDVFVDGVVRGLESGDFSRPALPGGSELDISFLKGDTFVASAVLKTPDGGLPVEQWLYSDGSVHAAPCTSPRNRTDAPEDGADAG